MNTLKRHLILLFIATGVTVGACSQNKEGGGPPPGMAVPVITADVTAQRLENRIPLVGSVIARDSVEIRSKINGTIEEIGFVEGTRVAKGKKLFAIDERKLSARLDEKEANFRLAKSNLERSRKLFESRTISEQEFDQAKSNFEASKAAVALAKEELREATIKAPFAGTMGRREVSLGQFVSLGTKLSTLTTLDPLEVEIAIPERYLNAIVIGQKVSLRVEAHPDESFEAQITVIDPLVDPRNRTILAKAELPNPDKKLRPGMFANLDLVIEIVEKAILIPEPAIFYNSDQAMVYVVDAENAVEIRPVRTGLRRENAVEILEGLETGERVIVEGTQKVGPGSKVSTPTTETTSDSSP